MRVATLLKLPPSILSARKGGEMKQTILKNPYYWKGIEAKKIEVGNIVSKKNSTSPALIYKVIKDEFLVVLYQELEGNKRYYGVFSSLYELDILMNNETGKPATQNELLEDAQNE